MPIIFASPTKKRMESTFCCLSDSDRLDVPRNKTILPSILDANIPIISRVGAKRTYIHTLVFSVYVGRMCYAFWSYIPLLVNPLFLLSGLRIRYLGHLYSSLKALMKNPLYICFFWGGYGYTTRISLLWCRLYISSAFFSLHPVIASTGLFLPNRNMLPANRYVVCSVCLSKPALSANHLTGVHW